MLTDQGLSGLALINIYFPEFDNREIGRKEI